LTDAPLSIIQPLQHDPMSQLSFGVSMRADDSVEVRLIRPGRPTPKDSASKEDVPDGRRRLFGLFPLTRKNGDCGF